MADPFVDARPDDLVALPVAIDGPRHLVDQVGSWVEAHLGWQVTTGDALPARLRLVGVGGPEPLPAQQDGPGDGGLPTIALVGPDDDPVTATRQGGRADAVVAWPREHDRLGRLATDLLGRQPGPRVELLRVGGAAGGVGTTIVALALGGHLAWGGHRCLVVVRGDVPVPDVRRVAPEVLSGHRAWAAATPVPHVPGLRAVGLATRVAKESDLAVVPPTGTRVVVDCGVDDVVDVLVVRRDRAGLAAIDRSSAMVVLAVEVGPRSHRDLVRAAGGRPVVEVGWSARVARAHDGRQVPAALPGVYLQSLAGIAD